MPINIDPTTLTMYMVQGGGFTSKANPNQLTITGSGFMSGPNVMIFDRFDGNHLESLTANRQADVGTWTNTYQTSGNDPATAKLYEDLGRTWFAHRDPAYLGINSKAAVAMFKYLETQTTEFRFSQRRWVPTDKWFPAATAPGQFPANGSVWKPTWFAGSQGNSYQDSTEQADLVFDSQISPGVISHDGNSCRPRSQSNSAYYTGFSFNQPTFTTWYQSGVPSTETFTEIGESLKINDEGFSFRQDNDVNPFDPKVDWNILLKYYLGFNFGGWFTDASDQSQVLPLMADCYYAPGPNSRACIYFTNNPVFDQSTDSYIVAPDSWSDTEIKVTPVARESNLNYIHLELSDGTIVENLSA